MFQLRFEIKVSEYARACFFRPKKVLLGLNFCITKWAVVVKILVADFLEIK